MKPIDKKRLENANTLIRTIGMTGRNFLYYKESYACFLTDEKNRLLYQDEYTKHILNTRDMTSRFWRRYFNHGGTMRDVIRFLRDYIKTGKPVPANIFGPWPNWMCDGDLWGYGSDMAIIRDKAVQLGIKL